MKIWKYPLAIEDRQNVPMPEGSRILSVQMQRDMPCLWVAVNPEACGEVVRDIEIIATGHPFEEAARAFLGTVQHGRVLVWHVFERL